MWVLPCMGYIGMYGPEGYGSLAVLVINRIEVDVTYILESNPVRSAMGR